MKNAAVNTRQIKNLCPLQDCVNLAVRSVANTSHVVSVGSSAHAVESIKARPNIALFTVPTSQPFKAANNITPAAAFFPDRIAPSIVAGRPVIRPIAGKEQVWPAGFGRRARRSLACSGVAAKVARRSFTICQGGSSAPKAMDRRDVLPQQLCQRLAILVDDGVAPDTVTDSRSENANTHLRHAADHAPVIIAAPGGVPARCRNRGGIHDGAELRRCSDIGHEVLGDPGRVSRARCDRPRESTIGPIRKIERARDPVAVEAEEAAQARTERLPLAPLSFRKASAGSMKARAQCG